MVFFLRIMVIGRNREKMKSFYINIRALIIFIVLLPGDVSYNFMFFLTGRKRENVRGTNY